MHDYEQQAEESQSIPLKIFLSYGRRDGIRFAQKIEQFLTTRGFSVWRDTQEIRAGSEWMTAIEQAILHSDLLVAILTPAAVRHSGQPQVADTDSVCLDELAYARFNTPPTPIVPVMAIPCEPPFSIFRLDFVSLPGLIDDDDIFLQAMQRLEDGIRATVSGTMTYRAWDLTIRPRDFGAFLAHKRIHFTGRDWLFAEVETWLDTPTNEHALLITGDPGTGKSALMAEMIYRNPGQRVLAYHCCQSDDRESCRPGSFVRNLAAMIASQFAPYATVLSDPQILSLFSETACGEDPFRAFDEGLLEPLHSLTPPTTTRRCILIDALDESLHLFDARGSIVDLLASRVERFPAWIGLVATTRKDPVVLRRLSALRAQALDANDPRNMDDLRLYISNRMASDLMSQKLKASGLSVGEVVDILDTHAQGNFLYARQALDGVERNRCMLSQIHLLPPGLEGLYQCFFERIYPDPEGFREAKALLQVMVAAQEPLDDEQLADVLKIDSDDDLPPLLKRLTGYIVTSLDEHGRQRYSIFHKSLRDWLTGPAREGGFGISSAKGHRLFADCFHELWRERPRASSTMSWATPWKEYFAKHAPLHALTAGEDDFAAAMLIENPGLFRLNLATAVTQIVFSTEGIVNKELRQFFSRVTSREEEVCLLLLIDVITSFMDCQFFDAARQVAESLEPQHPWHTTIESVHTLKVAHLQNETEKTINVARMLLEQAPLPDEVLALARWYLADSLRIRAEHQEAITEYKHTLQYIDRETAFTLWFDTRYSLSDLQYVYGHLEDARRVNADLLNAAEGRHCTRLKAKVYRLMGQVNHIIGEFSEAATDFRMSLSLFRQAHLTVEIVEALNSLAGSMVFYTPEDVPALLQESRRLAEQCHAFLELGKSYYIEGELMLASGHIIEACKAAEIAEERLSAVAYGSGVAHARLVYAEALLRQGDYEAAYARAQLASGYYRKECIYPSLRLRAYHLCHAAADMAGILETIHQDIDDPTTIQCLNQFPHIAEETEQLLVRCGVKV